MSTITESDLITLNSALTQLMRRLRRVDESHGVGRARLSALAVLHFGGPCSIGELAHSEMVTPATMHHVIKGLEHEGFVIRRADPADGRRQTISLTRKGTSVITAAHRARLQYLAELLEGVSEKALSTAATTLSRIRDNAALLEGSERG